MENNWSKKDDDFDLCWEQIKFISLKLSEHGQCFARLGRSRKVSLMDELEDEMKAIIFVDLDIRISLEPG